MELGARASGCGYRMLRGSILTRAITQVLHEKSATTMAKKVSRVLVDAL
jgi:hypothetical protein